jgi:hypothetical protein
MRKEESEDLAAVRSVSGCACLAAVRYSLSPVLLYPLLSFHVLFPLSDAAFPQVLSVRKSSLS